MNDSIKIVIDQEETLTYNLLPENTTNKNVTWSSDDENIASVDKNGIVKGIRIGSVFVRIKTSNNIYASCYVNVAPVYVTGISLSETEKTIEKESSIIIKAIITPSNATNKNIIWKSKNSSIATVDNKGTVKGKGLGTTDIVATTEDGNFSTTFTVTITPIKVKDITLNYSFLSLAIGETRFLTPVFTPENADNKNIKWSSENISVATISTDGTVNAISSGTTNVKIITEDGAKEASCKITVNTIDKLINVIALGRQISQTSNGCTIYLNSRIENPTSLPIRLNSVILTDENSRILDIQSGGATLNNNKTHYNSFGPFYYALTSINNSFFDLLSRYRVIYQFSYNNINYEVVTFINGHSWAQL